MCLLPEGSVSGFQMNVPVLGWVFCTFPPLDFCNGNTTQVKLKSGHNASQLVVGKERMGF